MVSLILAIVSSLRQVGYHGQHLTVLRLLGKVRDTRRHCWVPQTQAVPEKSGATISVPRASHLLPGRPAGSKL